MYTHSTIPVSRKILRSLDALELLGVAERGEEPLSVFCEGFILCILCTGSNLVASYTIADLCSIIIITGLKLNHNIIEL